MTLSAHLIRDFEQLRASGTAWPAAGAGVPFHEPSWLLTWWEYYSLPHPGERPRRELCAISVEQDGRQIGLAPWYVDPSPLWGRVVKQLGSGEVCSDYQTVLAAAGCEAEAAEAVADTLCGPLRNHWDRLDLDGATTDDVTLQELVAALERRGAPCERRPGPACWRLALPATFDDYLALLSKSHRKQLRRLQRNVLDTPRACWYTVRSVDDFAIAWPIFVDLHQRRRRSLGEAGCFLSPCFQAFHEEIARGLLARGMLRLHWLELDGRPAAAEYHFAAGGTIYAYQSGVDPDRLEEEPGRLAGIAVIREAIAEGFAVYDLLRGDEPYKAHWRAMPTATEQITVVNPRRRSRARHAVHQWLRRAKHLVLGAPQSPIVRATANSARGAAPAAETVADSGDFVASPR